MVTFGLIGCSKSKRGEGTDELYRAENLYNSWLFDGRVRGVKAHADAWGIMSAEHGLLMPDDIVGYYDTRITDDAVDEQALAELVVSNLPECDTLLVLMGRDYTEPLFEALPNDIDVWDPLKGVPLFEQRAALEELATQTEQTTTEEWL